MLVFDEVEYIIGKNSKKRDIEEISDLSNKLEKKINKKYGEEKSKIIRKCISECLLAHKNRQRKTGGLYAKHPLEVSLDSLNYKIDYITLGGAILHDVVEELVDGTIRRLDQNLSGEEKNKIRVKLRTENINELNNNLSEFVKKENLNSSKYINVLHSIVNLVSKVSRYKTEKQTYYEYLKNLFSEKFVIDGKKVSKRDIERAIIVKLLDRKNNIETMYKENEKPVLTNLKNNYSKLTDFYKTNKLKYILFKKKSGKIDLKDSFIGQRRLYSIWKNVYLINQTKEYLGYSRKSSGTKKIGKILEDLIKTTLNETEINKYILRLDPSLSLNYTNVLDREVLMYDDLGGLEKITERTEKSIKYEIYRSFDGTINRYTSMIHEDEKEIKHTEKNKKVQYRDTIAFERVLKKLLEEEKYRIRGVELLN